MNEQAITNMKSLNLCSGWLMGHATIIKRTSVESNGTLYVYIFSMQKAGRRVNSEVKHENARHKWRPIKANKLFVDVVVVDKFFFFPCLIIHCVRQAFAYYSFASYHQKAVGKTYFHFSILRKRTSPQVTKIYFTWYSFYLSV